MVLVVAVAFLAGLELDHLLHQPLLSRYPIGLVTGNLTVGICLVVHFNLLISWLGQTLVPQLHSEAALHLSLPPSWYLGDQYKRVCCRSRCRYSTSAVVIFDNVIIRTLPLVWSTPADAAAKKDISV